MSVIGIRVRDGASSRDPGGGRVPVVSQDVVPFEARDMGLYGD